MKKKTILLLSSLLILLLIYCWVDFDFPSVTGVLSADWLSADRQQNVNSYVQDDGDLQVFFCPHDNCEKVLVSFLDSAEQSIHCALFEIDLASVQQKLLEKQKNIDVKIVTDNQYLKEFNHSFVKADKWGLMHNKFCVIDGKKISGGSMNPTNNCANKNNNNLLLINSKILANNYEEEFQEMWNGTFKGGNKVRNPAVSLENPSGNIALITLKNYFCPEDGCAYRVEEELKKAQKSIYFLAFSFTHESIANALLLKNMDNITIKGVLEARQISEYSQFARLQHQGINVVKDGNKNNMHHKVFIIDEKTVITGSFNPTAGGDEKNDENVLIIEDKEIAKLFMKEFEYVWKEANII
ncbi:MAG: phospholipase D-like domain-containing protein [Nanoarchaeota archaeon]